MAGKNKREVWDYLMSIDYAICHGPLDRINQVWVKDKRILCDDIVIRTDRTIDQPKLWGGDDGEGGPVGVIECYMGTDNQEMSEPLARRYDLTPSTAPGYRGLAHLFFRGRNEDKGFRWISMNPYLPSAKASVTRIPKTLGSANALIPATVAIVDGTGNVSPQQPEEEPQAFLAGGNVPFWFEVGSADFRAFPATGMPYLGVAFSLAELGITSEELEQLQATGKIPVFNFTWLVGARDGDDNGLVTDVELEVTPLGGSGSTPIRFIQNAGEFTTITSSTLLPPGTTGVLLRTRLTRADQSGPEIAAIRNTLEWTFSYGDPTDGSASIPIYSGTGQDGYDVLAPSVHDLRAMGWNEFSIDNGLVEGNIISGIIARYTGLAGSGNAPYSFGIEVRFFGASDNDDLDYDRLPSEGGSPFLGPLSEDDIVSTNEEAVLDRMFRSGTIFRPPPGTRYILYRAFANLAIPLFSKFDSTSAGVGYLGPNVDPLHCPVDGTGLDQLPDANPAHIIHECMVNTEWGMGENPALLGDSFATAAATLYTERFGLSMRWMQQETIENFIQEVLDHIKATLFFSPLTGKWELKLFRADYDASTLRVFDEDNSRFNKRKRRGFGDIINEIVVSYTDPNTETDATVVSHALGHIDTQGGIVSETRDYYGIRNIWLAKQVADRDIAEASYPLFGCEIVTDRRAWNITPGDVLKISIPEDQIENMVVRVMDIDYGSPRDRAIKIQVVEDVFSLELTTFVSPQQSLFVEASDAPETLDAQMAVAAPYRAVLAANPDLADDDAQALVQVLASHDDFDPIDVELYGPQSTPGGLNPLALLKPSLNPLDSVVNTPELVAEATSTLELSVLSGLFDDEIAAETFLLLGESAADAEIVFLTNVPTASSPATIYRGCLDTTPRAWPAGTRLWRYPVGSSRQDPVIRGDGESLTYRLAMRTSQGTAPYQVQPDVSYVATPRQVFPFRPANCKLDGTGFGELVYNDSETRPSTVTATWANRNRLTEDVSVLRWDGATTAVEPSQTTELLILDEAGVQQDSITGLTGVTHDIPIATLSAVGKGSVEFIARRGGERSWQGHRVQFDVRTPGYGFRYGEFYGGSTGS